MDVATREDRIDLAEAAALRRLIADVLGAESGAETPFATPLLLFARLGVERQAALFRVDAGKVLIQEQLAVEVRDRLPLAAPIRVTSRIGGTSAVGGPILVEADLADPSGHPLGSVRAGLRAVPAEGLAAAKGLPPSRAAAGGDVVGRKTRPIDPVLTERWVRLVGDDNPVHVDEGYARELGLSGPIVPGALLAALAEDVAAATSVAQGARAVALNMRFVAPLTVGTAVEVEIRPKPAVAGASRRDLRLFFGDGARIAAVADLTMA